MAIKEELKAFSGKSDIYGGIALYIPEYDQIFTVSFGDGTNSDTSENCDDYLYMTVYGYDKEVAAKIKSCKYEEADWQDELEEIDGGQLDFNSKTAGYEDDIVNAVEDALRFLYNRVPEFVPLRLYHH